MGEGLANNEFYNKWMPTKARVINMIMEQKKPLVEVVQNYNQVVFAYEDLVINPDEVNKYLSIVKEIEDIRSKAGVVLSEDDTKRIEELSFDVENSSFKSFDIGEIEFEVLSADTNTISFL